MNHKARVSHRRAMSSIALGGVAVLALAACAGKHDNGGGASATTVSLTSQAACDTASKDGGGLNYWTSTDPEVFKQELAPFNAKYPNISSLRLSRKLRGSSEHATTARVCDSSRRSAVDCSLVAARCVSHSTLWARSS